MPPGFLLPVRVLSRLFRRLFLTALDAAFDAGVLQFFGVLAPLRHRQAFLQPLAPARHTDWVVYAKAPFAGPQQVLDYVGRYTHRVAIANARLVDIDEGHVRFRYKEYREAHPHPHTMTLSAGEFRRRFLLHVLPAGFHRIRDYGVLGNRHRRTQLARCRQCLGTPAPQTAAALSSTDDRDRYEALTGRSLRDCPICHDGHMLVIEDVARAPSRPAITDTS